MSTATHPDGSGSADPTFRAICDSPVGPLTIVASDAGVRAVLWPDDDPNRVPLADSRESSNDRESDDLESCNDLESIQPEHPVLAQAVEQLGQYFSGTRQTFDVPLDPQGTEFQQSAWMALRTIPFGETVSYGEQAEQMGDKRKARAVGAANGRNPISIIVPCHRVVGSNGSLTGFAGGLDKKAWLLQHESEIAGITLPF